MTPKKLLIKKCAVYKAVGVKRDFIGNKIAQKKCESKSSLWWELERYWRNCYSVWEKRKNIEWIKTIFTKWLNYWIIRWSNCIKIYDKKVDRGKWFISRSVYYHQNIRFNTPMLRSDLYDYSDACQEWHQKACGIIIEMKWTIMRMKMLLLVIIGEITKQE